MPKISQQDYQQRLDRLTEIYSDIVSHADEQATQRCPYRDARDRCTAAFSCGNQIAAVEKGEPATCGHDGTFDYSLAWETDPATRERARKRLGQIKQSAAARREGGTQPGGPGTVSHDGKTQPLAIGMTLFDCADELAVEVPTSCQRNGRCHECVVEVSGGEDALCARTEAESFLRPPYRLACQAVVERDDIDVTFAPLRRRPRILVRAHADAAGAPETRDPLVTRRGADVLYDGHVVDRYRGHMLGLAIDLGTTTVVLDFVDLETGRAYTAPPSRTRKPSAAATSCTASPTTAMTRPASCRRPPRPPSAAPLWTAAPGSGWAARRSTRSWSRPTPPCATSCSSSTCRELGRNPTSPPSSTPFSRASAPTRR